MKRSLNEVWPACMDEVITVRSFNNDNKSAPTTQSYAKRRYRGNRGSAAY